MDGQELETQEFYA